MKSTVLFFVFCFVIASYAQINIAMVEKSDFGKTLLEAVQLHLQSQEPIEVLTKMLSDMATQLAKDQENADSKHSAFQKSCKEDVDFLNNAIDTNKAKIQQAQDDLDSLRPRLATALKNLDSWSNKLENLQNQLAAILETRAQEAEEYQKKVAEHERAIIAVSEAKKLFSTLLTKKSAFLQSKQTIFTQLTSSLRSAASEMQTVGYKAIFNLLAQVAEKAPVQADQSVVEKILNLCQKVLDNINDSAQQEKTAENVRIAIFQKSKAKLDSDIAEANGQIARLKNLISSLRASIKATEQVLKEQQEDLAKNQKSLGLRVAECNNEAAAYAQDRKKRTEERDTVDQVITIVNTKLATLKAYLRKRVENA